METKMSPLEVVAFAFVEPEYARQEYFKNKQKESGYSVPVFVKKLEDAVKVLSNEAHKNDWRNRSGDRGFTAIPQVNLYELTKGRYNGSINDTHLKSLLMDLKKIFVEEPEERMNKIKLLEEERDKILKEKAEFASEKEMIGKLEKIIESVNELPNRTENPLSGKQLLLFFYFKKNIPLGKKNSYWTKINNLLKDGYKKGTFENDFREMKYFIEGDERLKDGQLSTFETYKHRILNGDLDEGLKGLNLI